MKRFAMIVLAAGLCLAFAAPAYAGPVWRIDSLSNSTTAPGSTLQYLVQVENVGDAPTNGGQETLVARLPSGMTAVDATVLPDAFNAPDTEVACTAGDGSSPVLGATVVQCVIPSEALAPTPGSNTLNFQMLNLDVRLAPNASGTLNSTFTVSGAGAPDAQTVDPTRVTAAAPVFGIDAFDGQLTDASGAISTQAGAHPANDTVSIDFNTLTKPDPQAGPDSPVEPAKDVTVDLPPGLVGDPTVVDQCTEADLSHTINQQGVPLCAPNTQVGTVILHMDNRPFGMVIYGPIPVYNVVPPPNVPARFGLNVAGTIVALDARLRSDGDYGLSIDSKDISEALGIAGTQFTFWGVPSDSSHDSQRACSGGVPPGFGGPTCPSGAPRAAFLRNPTSCTAAGVGLPTTARVDSWFNPGVFDTATFVSHQLPGYPAAPSSWGAQVGPTGCDRVPFDPTLRGQPAVATPNAPSGFAFDVALPQSSDPDVVGESDLRSAVVTLPSGVRVNPSAADGLQGCSSAQIHLHDTSSPDCPDASKVGAVTVTTPLLRDPLQGSIYLATPGDNPFGTLLSIYVVAEGSGVVVKLAGRVDADPVTGQLTTTFDDNPQTPFSDLHLQFDGGPRAQLVTPPGCATYTTHAVFTGWNGRQVETDSPFTISGDGNGAPCPAPRFAPVMSGGTASNRAGSTSSLLLRFTRDDLDQELGALTVNLPSGLTGKIANAVLCSAADAANGTCPAGSKIGDVTVGAGAGSNPFFITNGRAYLTGPYKGAPFGVSIVVPAVAGPFNLGNVVVRSALFVDKHTADVRVVSDPLPTILQGIPLQVRDVRVNVDKPDFFVNPTSCAVKTITGTLTSTGGMSANVSDRFQAAECANLGFKPRMVLTVGGRGHTRAGQPTPLSTTVTMPKGDANLRYVRVTLPKTINARLTVINDACTRAQFESNIAQCAHAKAGTATAVTPLLRDPLRGSVYFVKNGHPIPDLFIALRGQVAFDLIGRVTIPGGTHLATTFNATPDVPLRSFTLKLLGDRKNGSVGAAANLCSASSRKATAALDYIGQNGKVLQVDQALKVAGCPKPKPKARRARRRG